MWHAHDGPDGWGLLWMSLMMAFVWIPALLILVWALRGLARPAGDEPPPTTPPAEPDAREIARRAYAGGELDRERYLQIVEDLDGTASRQQGN